MRRRWLVCAALCAGLGSGLAAGTKQIAITFDDLPVASTVPISLETMVALNASLLEVLKRHRVEAIGFVNEDRLYRKGEVDARIDILRGWLDAGMALGNHNFGHVGLWQTPLAAVEDAVIKGEVVTRMISSERHSPLRFYRPPYTQTGRDEDEKAAFEKFLASRGYRVAPFTIEHDDYLYSCVYDHSQLESDRQRIVDEYLAHLKTSVQVYETMSQELFGRQIAQILLIHANRLNARTLDATLQILEADGYAFVSLDEAMKDPAYLFPAFASGRFGPSWLARWARASKIRLSTYGQPDPVGWTAAQAPVVCGAAEVVEY